MVNENINGKWKIIKVDVYMVPQDKVEPLY